jgi:putative endonuclease
MTHAAAVKNKYNWYGNMNYYVYILASKTNVTIYTGVTNDLVRRVYEHRQNILPESFTAKYGVHKLVYYEQTGDVRAALEREKQIKSWKRVRKNALVESLNPTWEDLYPKLLE